MNFNKSEQKRHQRVSKKGKLFFAGKGIEKKNDRDKEKIDKLKE